MASSYPASLDTFTNPTGADTQDSPDHAGQHADANDAVEALEAKVGIGSSPATGASAKQVLQADGAGASAWATVAANDLSDVDTATTSPSVGDALVFDGTNWVPDSGTYRRDDESIFVSAAEMFSYAGSPNLTRMGRHPVWYFDDSTTEGLCFGLLLPSTWATYDIDTTLVTTTGNSGNAVLDIYRAHDADGDDASTQDQVHRLTAAVSAAANTFDVQSHATGISYTAGDLVGFTIARLGGDGTDTLTGDLGLVGLTFKKAS